ncbi:MAG: TIGR00269 family protein [Candidatus Thorarchaeota archaeon]
MSNNLPMCYKCSKPAVTFRKIDGRYFCKGCYSKWVISTVRKTIREKKLFGRHDRIIVGLSGGKDSTVLLDILTKVENKYPTEIIAVCIDEGIIGYREDGLPIAQANANRLGVEYYQYSFKELFGYSLDEIVTRARELQQVLPIDRKTRIIQHGACSFCGVFRRKALNIAARELHGDKVATGHNLNDVTQTILLNLLRGDSFKLLRGDIPPEKMHDSFVPRVKPLQSVTERDVVLYAFYNDIVYHTTECPYSVEAMRLDVRNFVTEIEEKYPGTVYCIKNSMETIGKNCSDNGITQINNDEELNSTIFLCEQCSEPSSSKICKGCQMLNILFKDNHNK